MGKERRERRAIENTASGVDNTHRKTWNKEEFEEQAEKREEKVCFNWHSLFEGNTLHLCCTTCCTTLVCGC